MEQIITSFLDTDLYKFSMGQRAMRMYGDANVEWKFVCRNKDGDAVYALAEELRKQVEEYLFPEILHITCSIGVTEIRKDDTFAEAFDRVDKALYASKQNGRNMVTRL